MTLNCKPGDLAIIVSTDDGTNTGAIVQVLRSAPKCSDCGAHQWLVSYRGDEHYCCDPSLRPIRDSEDPDETITWAGKPNETPAEIIQRETA